MTEYLYVSTDSEGIEHSAGGAIAWELPNNNESPTTERSQGLTLRSPVGLLEVLEECIYRAETLSHSDLNQDGIVRVTEARLLSKANWNTEAATRFALDCAEHIVGEDTDLTLPDGTLLAKAISDGRRALDGLYPDDKNSIGYLGKLAALHRLRRDRGEVSDVSLGLLVDANLKDMDALDDASYASIVPVVDAVLAAIEALREHLLPHFETAHNAAEEHKELDRTTALKIPVAEITPFGAAEVGGSHVARDAPAAASAREAARHARFAAKDRSGATGESAEQAWQAATLASYLEQH